MKYKLIVLLGIILSFKIYSQNNTYYYHKGKKVQIKVLENVFYTNNNYIVFDTNKFISKQNGEGRIVKLKINNHSELKSEIVKFKVQKNELNIQPVIDNGKEVPLSGEFYVRIKNEQDTLKLKKLALDTRCKNLKKVEYMPYWYSLKTNSNSKGNALEMSNFFTKLAYLLR